MKPRTQTQHGWLASAWQRAHTSTVPRVPAEPTTDTGSVNHFGRTNTGRDENVELAWKLMESTLHHDDARFSDLLCSTPRHQWDTILAVYLAVAFYVDSVHDGFARRVVQDHGPSGRFLWGTLMTIEDLDIARLEGAEPWAMLQALRGLAHAIADEEKGRNLLQRWRDGNDARWVSLFPDTVPA